MEGDKHHKTHLKVSVTGGAGSGKSSVCSRFKELGAWVISADEVARKVVRPGYSGFKKIVEHFGKAVLQSNGTLNRRKMREIMLSDETAKTDLERLIHPEILDQMNIEIRKAVKAAQRLIVVEVPLLFELNMADEFDHVVMVSADADIKVKRLTDRDRVSEADARALVTVQMSDELKEKQSDDVIRNNKSLKDLITAVDELYCRLAAKLSETA
jgi:dephospho-CoA kinase